MNFSAVTTQTGIPPSHPLAHDDGLQRRCSSKLRVAFIFTHRIQYFSNLLDELHHRGAIEVAAIYAHDTELIDDSGFGLRIRWNNRTNTSFNESVLRSSAARPHGQFLSSFSLELFERLDSFGPDVIHLNGYSNIIQWLALLWGVARGVPTVSRGDGDTLSIQKRRSYSPHAILARMFSRQLSHVFHQGPENRKFWMTRGADPSRMSWIPCVSDSEIFRRSAFASTEERSEFRSRHGARPHDVIFVLSGKLEDRKRPADAIEALARCRSGAARLWFLGSGPLAEELATLGDARGVGSRITWMGFRNQSEIPKVLQAADVLVHTSRQDPWPYSVLEGAISGLALILSDKVGSHPDWIHTGQAGLLFPCGDVGALAASMDTIITNPAMMSEFKRAARRASTRHTEAHFCERLEEVIKKFGQRRHE